MDDLSTVLGIIPKLPRWLLEEFVSRAIEHLDELDGDPDLEPHCDDEDDRSSAPAEYGADQRNVRYWGRMLRLD